MEDLGAFVLIPTLLVFILAVVTHRPIESLIAGSLVGLGMAHGSDFISGFADTSLRPARNMWALVGTPVRRIKQIDILVRVTMRPAIYRYCGDVPFCIEATRTEHATHMGID